MRLGKGMTVTGYFIRSYRNSAKKLRKNEDSVDRQTGPCERQMRISQNCGNRRFPLSVYGIKAYVHDYRSI